MIDPETATNPKELLRILRENKAEVLALQAIEDAKPKTPEPVTASFLSHLRTKDGTPMVVNKDGEVVTTSLLVAEYFGKRHDNVVRSIAKWLERIEPSDHFLTLEEMVCEVDTGKGATREMTYVQRQTVSRDGSEFLTHL